MQLSVGQTAQQIVVKTEAPLLETATPELSMSMPTETLQELPQTGSPDWQQNIVLLPGTVGNASNTANPGMGGVSVNGSLPYSSFLLDGAMSNSTVADNVVIIPVFDAIAEVKIIDSLSSAQYPTGGILYNEISKGGSNKIHGMAYNYLRNTAFNAAKVTPSAPAVFRPFTLMTSDSTSVGRQSKTSSSCFSIGTMPSTTALEPQRLSRFQRLRCLPVTLLA